MTPSKETEGKNGSWLNAKAKLNILDSKQKKKASSDNGLYLAKWIVVLQFPNLQHKTFLQIMGFI
jgi:hypothetical protein